MENLDPTLQIDKGCVLIVEAGHSLSCSDVTICKGMLIYHQYQKMRKEYQTYFHLIATAALSLSIQICEEDVKLEDVQVVFKALGTYVRDGPCASVLKSKLLEVQYDMYRLVFDWPYRKAITVAVYDEVHCETAHRYALKNLNQLVSVPMVKENFIPVKVMMLKLLTTFYHCQKCTFYTALEIAWAAIVLTSHYYLIPLESLKPIKKELNVCVSDTRVRDAIDDIMVASDIGTFKMDYSIPIR